MTHNTTEKVEQDTTRIKILIPEQLLNEIDRVLKDDGTFINRQEYIRHAIRNQLKHESYRYIGTRNLPTYSTESDEE